MYVNAFAGTLSGVREKLDYIEESGVNYLHLMPLLESPEGRSDGGYAAATFAGFSRSSARWMTWLRLPRMATIAAMPCAW